MTAISPPGTPVPHILKPNDDNGRPKSAPSNPRAQGDNGPKPKPLLGLPVPSCE